MRKRVFCLITALAVLITLFSCSLIGPSDNKSDDEQSDTSQEGNENMNNDMESVTPEKKSIKILVIGNSYGNDATYYLSRMLEVDGYEDITIGKMGESSMAINDHYHNIDNDPSNDYLYKGNTFSVHRKSVNGKNYDLPADYKMIVRCEPWDYILFYQGPNSAATLTEPEYYSETDNFLKALKENMTNPDGKIIYYMTWAHNVDDTSKLYQGIVDITKEVISSHPLIDGVLPAATVIQNLRTSYLVDGKAGDITRDWGHLNYGVGRYAMALSWYVYLTGGSVEDITFMPTFEDEMKDSPDNKPLFTDVDENNLKVIREAVENAMKTPYSVTESKYRTAP